MGSRGNTQYHTVRAYDSAVNSLIGMLGSTFLDHGMLDEARIQFGQLAKEELGALGFVSDYELSEQDRAEMDNDWKRAVEARPLRLLPLERNKAMTVVMQKKSSEDSNPLFLKTVFPNAVLMDDRCEKVLKMASVTSVLENCGNVNMKNYSEEAQKMLNVEFEKLGYPVIGRDAAGRRKVGGRGRSRSKSRITTGSISTEDGTAASTERTGEHSNAGSASPRFCGMDVDTEMRMITRCRVGGEGPSIAESASPSLGLVDTEMRITRSGPASVGPSNAGSPSFFGVDTDTKMKKTRRHRLSSRGPLNAGRARRSLGGVGTDTKKRKTRRRLLSSAGPLNAGSASPSLGGVDTEMRITRLASSGGLSNAGNASPSLVGVDTEMRITRLAAGGHHTKCGRLKIPQGDGDNDDESDSLAMDIYKGDVPEESVLLFVPAKPPMQDQTPSEIDMLEDPNYMVCQYDKISRKRTCWKLHMADGVAHVDGKDYVFGRAVVVVDIPDPNQPSSSEDALAVVTNDFNFK